jgi:hypothetical protein
MMTSQNSVDWIQCRIRRNVQCKSDREFWDVFRKHKYAIIRPTVQKLRSLEIGKGVSFFFGQIKLSGQIWTLQPHLKEIWTKSEHKDPREFYKLSNEG